MARYPRELERTVQLSDGAKVLIRPIRPEDRALEQAFVEGLSPSSRYFRFLDTLASLSPKMLTHFTEVDYDRHMALIAVHDHDRVPTQIGVTRYVATESGDSCEFAIVVADQWQHRGVGGILLRTLIDVARQKGLKTMFGDVLASNQTMFTFVARMGFRTEPVSDDPRLRRVTLALSPQP
jgi:acetyltransferase